MFHVVPQNDEQEHVCSGTSCPCGPEVKLDDASGEMICVHHAFDCREVLEQAAEIMNAARQTQNADQKKVEVSDEQLTAGASFNATIIRKTKSGEVTTSTATSAQEVFEHIISGIAAMEKQAQAELAAARLELRRRQYRAIAIAAGLIATALVLASFFR